MRNKFDPKSKKGVFVGYSNDSLAYLVLFPETGRIVTSRDVIFDEKLNDLSAQLAKREALRLERQAKFDAAIEAETKRSSPGSTSSTQPLKDATPSEGATDNASVEEIHDDLSEVKLMNPEPFLSVFAATSPVSTESDPETYQQAVSGPRNDEWKKAILEEYASLCARGVFDLQSLPKGKKAIPVRWLFKTKFDKDGSVSRYKARLVVKRFH